MAKKKRIFSVDFKKQVVREVETGVCGLTEAARRLRSGLIIINRV